MTLPLITLINLQLISALRCPPCEKLHCSRLSKSSCKGGITTSICGCCAICAKVKGERCGGEYQYLGKCDKGLYCQPLTDKSNIIMYHGKAELIGSCTKRKFPGPQADEGKSSYCRPECSPIFCKRNPRAICSAIKVADIKQGCQERCQHTSCNACSYRKEADCPKCRKNDFRCMKKYGKCIMRDFCSRRKFPCKRKRLKIVEDGKFVCKVPECLK
ncbi:hypothetical protein LOTGIDRAFT_102422 [Lottia gigantea]|uniref:IGFBP N-terminal domain-containing protein n=1 Tax=Lottia gigantea TaxID=225164 RepID=V4BC18_LOTGI|nr:hypothetical protein LOTGIDRAFT_102422 [Lottia gigantea]ESP05166.1 hypothetical protein LOTGIDRAFT_102422 [Lottia gigantea]